MKDGASALESRIGRGSAYDVEMLERIQRRVLWLCIYMVHYANFVREASASKVGGHQASSTSVVTEGVGNFVFVSHTKKPVRAGGRYGGEQGRRNRG